MLFCTPSGEQFALMACGSAFLLCTQPGPEVCRGRTPSHTCNPRRPPGNHAKPPLPSHSSLPSTPLSKIRAALRHTSTLHSSLFSIHLTRPSAGSSSRSWPAGELPFSTRSRARNCAGAVHPRTPAIPEDRRAASLTPSSPSQSRLLPIHPFLKSVPQCGTPNLFTLPYSLFTKKAPAGRKAS